MMWILIVALGFAIFGIGIAGVAATRHFIVMMVSVEIAIGASIIVSAASFRYAAPGNIMLLMFTIWAVASTEIIAALAIYKFMSMHGISMDITKLSRIKD
jgi:NADH:ubiquinone oxidoreductase subunit K